MSGGGVEFVRSISQELYGVPPELVVGTKPAYEFSRDAEGRPRLIRAPGLGGRPNEGAEKVEAIQPQLGRRPVLAASNSAGDRDRSIGNSAIRDLHLQARYDRGAVAAVEGAP